MFFKTEEGLYAGFRTIWADWAFHLAYSNVFAYRPLSEWFSHHPLFYPVRFNYPFVASFISGMLTRIGVDSVSAFVVPAILITLGFLAILFLFYRMLLKSNTLSFLGVTLFLTSGGLGFIFFPASEYTSIPEKHIYWMNMVTSEMLPQRPFMLGVGVGLLLLIVVYGWVKKEFKNVSNWQVFLLGLTTSLVTFVHMHSFFSLGLIALVLFVGYRKYLRQWGILLAGVCLPTLIIYFVHHRTQSVGGFFAWHFGWMAGEGKAPINVFYFWILNWGLFLPLALWATWREKWYKEPFVVAGAFLFVLCNIVKFQPWIWDNSKILSWSYLLLAIPVASYLGLLWKKKEKRILSRALAGILFVTLTLSGFLDLWSLNQTSSHTHQMFNQDQLNLATEFRQISKPLDLVLTSDDHHNWVMSLTGRQVLMGYTGWLWTYGINSSSLAREMRTMFAGGHEAEALFEKYGVDYVVIGRVELQKFAANEAYFKKNYNASLSTPSFRVYQISE